MYKIYKLIHNGEVVYIGRTKCSLIRRKGAGYKSNIKLQEIYKECDIELIEETDDVSRERYWIAYYRNNGCDLLNTKNGDGLDVKLYYKEYWVVNKKQKVEYDREYRDKNRDVLREKWRIYDRTNRNRKKKEEK